MILLQYIKSVYSAVLSKCRYLSLKVKRLTRAEPISDLIGGAACFLTMWFMIYKKLGREEALPTE